MADSTLASIRQKYPQYADMPDAALADAIHKKFYADMPREEFDKRVGLKAEVPPVAMEDPGFGGRLSQRLKAQYDGTEAPILPADAGAGARIADVFSDVGDYLSSAADTLARGFTLGASDDVNAVARTMATDETFSEANAIENEKIRKFKEANPVIGNTLEIVGGVGSPVGQLGGKFIANGSTMATRALRAAPIGASLGAASGLGYSEGDAGDRLTGTVLGAVAGGALAPAFGLAFEGGSNLVGKAVTAGKDFFSRYGNPDEQALKLLARSLARDGVDPQALASNAARPGPEGIVDLAGPNTVALGRQATVAPGNARTVAEDFFEGRRADAANRTRSVISGVVPEDARLQIAALEKSKQSAASPLYREAYAADPETLNTPYVNQVLNSPVAKEALARAKRLWDIDRLSGRVDGDPFTPMLDAEGNLTLTTAPDMRILDYMKRGMDQLVDEAYKSSGTAGNAMKAARDAFRTHLRDINPEYGVALDAYSGPSHVQDLIAEGMDFFKGRSQDKIRAIARLQGDDLKAFRIGAVRAAMDKLDKVTDAGSVYAMLGNSTEKRNQLKALFPDRADFDKVFNQLLREREMFNAERVVMGGSPTARIDADKADAADAVGIASNLMEILSGNIGSGVRGIYNGVANPARGLTEPVANRLGELLFSNDPALKQQALNAILGLSGNNSMIRAGIGLGQGRDLFQKALAALRANKTVPRIAGGEAARLISQGAGGATGSVR